MNWREFALPVLIIGIPLIGASSCSIRDDRLDTTFNAITTGMSSQQIDRIMGSPSWKTDCEHGRLPEISKPTNCATELGYSATLAWTGFYPRWWLVWFGPEGKVIGSAKITSP